MSDLQCPARFVVLTPATATACEVSELKLSLVVCACPCDEPVLQRLAAAGCTVQRTPLHTGAELATHIEQLADSYRGEQVAMLASSEVVCSALQLPAAPSTPVHIAVDSDGWNVIGG